MKRLLQFPAILDFRIISILITRATICILFVLNLPLISMPIGNPSLPFLLQEGLVIPDTSWSNPQCGFTGDYLFQKRFRTCHSSKRLNLSKAFLSGASEIATFAWSIRERFNIQVGLGSGQYSWGWIQKGKSILGNARGSLLWGGDAKLIIFNIRDTILGLDAQAGGWDWMEGSTTVNGKFGNSDATSLLRYWQIGAAITQNISLFSPYLGFAINRTRFKACHLATGTVRLHARHQMGPFVGCSICNGNSLLLNVEWRGWFEEGIAVTAQLRF